MKPEWMTLPTHALHCYVEGVELVDGCDINVLQTALAEVLLMKTLMAKFIKVCLILYCIL